MEIPMEKNMEPGMEAWIKIIYGLCRFSGVRRIFVSLTPGPGSWPGPYFGGWGYQNPLIYYSYDRCQM